VGGGAAAGTAEDFVFVSLGGAPLTQDTVRWIAKGQVDLDTEEAFGAAAARGRGRLPSTNATERTLKT
jgi:hypothetical protein